MQYAVVVTQFVLSRQEYIDILLLHVPCVYLSWKVRKLQGSTIQVRPPSTSTSTATQFLLVCMHIEYSQFVRWQHENVKIRRYFNLAIFSQICYIAKLKPSPKFLVWFNGWSILSVLVLFCKCLRCTLTLSLSIATSSQTPTQPPTQPQPPTTKGSSSPAGASAGAIAGGVIGGLVGAVLIVLIIVVIVFLIWRTKNSPSKYNSSVHRMFSKTTKESEKLEPSQVQSLEIEPRAPGLSSQCSTTVMTTKLWPPYHHHTYSPLYVLHRWYWVSQLHYSVCATLLRSQPEIFSIRKELM